MLQHLWDRSILQATQAAPKSLATVSLQPMEAQEMARIVCFTIFLPRVAYHPETLRRGAEVDSVATTYSIRMPKMSPALPLTLHHQRSLDTTTTITTKVRLQNNTSTLPIRGHL